MPYAILSAGTGWHVRDLQRAAKLLDDEAIAVDFRTIGAAIGRPRLQLADCSRVIVRTMPPGSLEQVVFRMDVLHRLQAEGVVVVNPARALEICIDKYLASAMLAAAGLRTPPTIVCQRADEAMEAFANLDGDVIVKPLFGSEGRGMQRISDADLAWRTFHTLERLQCVLYVQKFIAHPGWDLRVFVIGGRPLAAMRRRGVAGWRTNVAQGAQAETAMLKSHEEELALRAAAAVGTVVAGVDLLPGPDGDYYVLEVNAVPGWRALARATGVDVAFALLRHIARIQ